MPKAKALDNQMLPGEPRKQGVTGAGAFLHCCSPANGIQSQSALQHGRPFLQLGEGWVCVTCKTVRNWALVKCSHCFIGRRKA